MTEPTKDTLESPETEYKVERPQPKMTRKRKLRAAALLGSAGAVALWLLWPSSNTIPTVETSAVEEFQRISGGSPFGEITPIPEPAGADGGGFAIAEATFDRQREGLEGRNAQLQEEVERLQQELTGIADRAGTERDATSQELALALEKAQAQNLALIEDIRREFSQKLDTLGLAANATGPGDAEREAELAAKRAEREAQLLARISSPSVVFDNGKSGGTRVQDIGSMESSSSGSRDATGRDFVQSGREATDVETSQIIANPSNTVLQGTLIDATLENAVDSSLPGQLTAIVTRPVWSFDQSQVLIPAGSRLFGDYSSEIAIGQGRILVAWTRLVTPDGQSVRMEAFGGDAQGRSGITGRVRTRFVQRFGSAALISLLGAIPAIVVENRSGNVSSDTLEDVSGDFGATVGSAMETYTNLPPIITVAPGSSITVMVDRDLEVW
ncbi:MAG: hypothetical protein DI533_17155 [Cereibacter sphaeroides]|uniref:Conjugal transfer protein n=1 Tax=Cereibacter sphaeroides TaxID=1063 RepID=A0A2W5S7W0_CERSP|nr:MAG: hypothetical protein DI533_17155 [Cereibacter sphaeroides]